MYLDVNPQVPLSLLLVLGLDVDSLNLGVDDLDVVELEGRVGAGHGADHDRVEEIHRESGGASLRSSAEQRADAFALRLSPPVRPDSRRLPRSLSPAVRARQAIACITQARQSTGVRALGLSSRRQLGLPRLRAAGRDAREDAARQGCASRSHAPPLLASSAASASWTLAAVLGPVGLLPAASWP